MPPFQCYTTTPYEYHHVHPDMAVDSFVQKVVEGKESLDFRRLV